MPEEKPEDTKTPSPEELIRAVDELSTWLKEVVTTEGFVDAGFVLVVRNGRLSRKRRIHESVE